MQGKVLGIFKRAMDEQNTAATAVVHAQKRISVGRPSVITEKVVRKLIAAFQRGLSDTTACEEAGISRDTFYRHLNENQEFSDRITHSKNFIKVLASNKLVKILTEGTDRDAIPLIKFVLERKAPDAYGMQQAEVLAQQVNVILPAWYTETRDAIRAKEEEEDRKFLNQSKAAH